MAAIESTLGEAYSERQPAVPRLHRPTSSRRPRDVIGYIAGVEAGPTAVADAVGAADDMELVAGVALRPGAFPSVAGALDAVQTDVARRLHPRRRREGERPRGARARRACRRRIERADRGEDYAEIDALARERAVGVIAADASP